MKTRMCIVETDHYGMTDRKFYIDDPIHVPRVGEFVDGGKAVGWVDHVQWNFPMLAGQSSVTSATVYVHLSKGKP